MSARPTPWTILGMTLGATLALGLVAGRSAAQAPKQPPMNDFNQAFYRCDGGGAFMMSYDSDQPTAADMAGNDESKHHALKRTPSPSGVEFTGGGVKFWTDGKTVLVEGAKAPFKNCKMKTG
jgi:membrane-bound inhibitor of C-type lysozyme